MRAQKGTEELMVAESTRNRTFISYAHEDLVTVRQVVSGLKKRNVNVWFDKEHLTDIP